MNFEKIILENFQGELNIFGYIYFLKFLFSTALPNHLPNIAFPW